MKRRKIASYSKGNNVSILVREAITNEDCKNYHKEVNRFFNRYPGNSLSVGSLVNWGGVSMIVIKSNSNKIKLEVE